MNCWTGVALMLAIAVVLLLLTGCMTSTGIAIAEAGKAAGKQAAARALTHAEFYICRASPVGAVQDAYGVSQARREAWRELCLHASSEPVIE